jgi:hypothetical protein
LELDISLEFETPLEFVIEIVLAIWYSDTLPSNPAQLHKAIIMATASSFVLKGLLVKRELREVYRGWLPWGGINMCWTS